MKDPNQKYIEAPQILKAFDEHMDKFMWRIRDLQESVEIEAYRQLVDSLTYELNKARNVKNKLEYVFKCLGIDPRETPHWATKGPDNDQ